MRVLVTGASGFLGSYLVADLLEQGHEVGILVRESAPWRLVDVIDRVTLIIGSLDDIDAMRAPVGAFAPEAVAHMAWRGVGNMDRNKAIQARNIWDAAELATLLADLKVSIFVGAGSQAEYGPYKRPITPEDATHPTTLYGKAKLAASSICEQIASESHMRFAWLRIFSTYGPKDADNWLIPSFIKTVVRGERMSLTSCEQRWGFLHARDAAAAFRVALTEPRACGYFNVGHPDGPMLSDTLTRLRDLINPSAILGFGDIPYRPDQVMVLQADTARMMQLGWEPQVKIEDGLLEKTVSWYVPRKRA
ncbi:UDP-glucose 4-epimerase [Bradyrhizobium sp. GM5.1]